jgi:hypothetical protein
VAEHPPFVFFLGCGRSGTTLMRACFDAHPDMAIPTETHFPLKPPAAWLDVGGRPDAARMIADLEPQRWFEGIGRERARLMEATGDEAPATYADLLRTFFRVYAVSEGKSRYGNKTPKHVYAIPALATLFPEARFVHIVRDGRDVTLSYLEQDFGPSDVRTAARLWRERVEIGRRSGEARPDRYVEVRYEDLLADPVKELSRLCAFADLPFDDAMLDYQEREQRRALGRDPHRHLWKPPTKGLRDWRTQMSRADLVLFESIAGDTLRAFGYEPSGLAPTVRDRVDLWAGDLTESARRSAARLRLSAGKRRARWGAGSRGLDRA